MNEPELELARAAAALTVEDYRYLEGRGMLCPRGPSSGEDDSPESASPEAASEKAQDRASKERADQAQPHPRRRGRRTLSRTWPEVGTVLYADYQGRRYEAEVVQAPKYRSGRAFKVLTGPAAGRVCHSLSGAMLAATEAQRKEQGLGMKGVSNGWAFWKAKED